MEGPNYFGGEFRAPEIKPLKEESLSFEQNNDLNVVEFSRGNIPESAEMGSNLERRRELLREARELVIKGASLVRVDDVDIFECQYIPAGNGPLEMVYDGAVVGYAKEAPTDYKQEIKFN
jgi:hypothetical protein